MGWVERCIATVAGITVLAGVSVLVARSDVPDGRSTAEVTVQTAGPTPVTASQAPAPGATKAPLPPVTEGTGALRTTAVAYLRIDPSREAPITHELPKGMLAPITARAGEFFQILTPHEVTGWVHDSKVRTYEKAGPGSKVFEEATIVIDPGHGGHLPGAKGPGGFLEKDANLAISRKLVRQLEGARVFLTRTDGHAGLAYRSELANRLGAHAFVSVHNNALPDFTSREPGAEIYHQVGSHTSKRLAGLIYEEVFAALRRYDIEWGRDPFAGAKYRKSHKHGGDYYAVLRMSKVPAVITETMFITHGPEEQLLRRAEVRQVVADALGRGIKRFLTTDDPGSGFQDPYARPTPECPIPGCFEHRK